MRTTIKNTTLASQLGQLAVARQIKKTQDELQWIVAQRLLSALTIPGFSYVVCKRFIIPKVRNYVSPPILLTAAMA